MAIISAGVIMNLIFGVIMAAVAYKIGTPIQPASVGRVSYGSNAWLAGWQPGYDLVGFSESDVASHFYRFTWDLRYAVIGGGILARELTTVFSRLGAPGVRAIIANPPFPLMQQAYRDKPITEEEVDALVAFLERADAEQGLHRPRAYGITLFTAGLLGSMILLVLYSVIWSGRKRASVNQDIFSRQVRST